MRLHTPTTPHGLASHSLPAPADPTQPVAAIRVWVSLDLTIVRITSIIVGVRVS